MSQGLASLCLSWFSPTSGPYFLVSWCQERDSTSTFPNPGARPWGTFLFLSQSPGGDAPCPAGSAKYFPVLLNITAAAVAPLGPQGPHPVSSHSGGRNSPCVYQTVSETEGRAGNRTGQAISLKLLLRCLVTTSSLVAEVSHVAGTGPEGLEASFFPWRETTERLQTVRGWT